MMITERRWRAVCFDCEAAGHLKVDGAIMAAMTIRRGPESTGTIRLRCRRHALVLPPSEEALVDSPTWLRRKGRSPFADGPVSLVMALEEEPAARHPSMIAAHSEVLLAWAKLANDLLIATPPEAPERKTMGFNVLIFCAELASALHSERFGPMIAPDLRSSALEVVAQATLQVGGCLAATVCDYQDSLA